MPRSPQLTPGQETVARAVPRRPGPRVCAGPGEGWDRLGQPGNEETPVPGVTVKLLLIVAAPIRKVIEPYDRTTGTESREA